MQNNVLQTHTASVSESVHGLFSPALEWIISTGLRFREGKKLRKKLVSGLYRTGQTTLSLSGLLCLSAKEICALLQRPVVGANYPLWWRLIWAQPLSPLWHLTLIFELVSRNVFKGLRINFVCVCVFNSMFNWVVKVVPQPPGAEEDKNHAVRDHVTHTRSTPSVF